MSYVAMFFRCAEVSVLYRRGSVESLGHADAVPFRCGDVEGAEQSNTNGTSGQWPNNPVVNISMIMFPFSQCQ